MKRREFITLLAGTTAMWPLAARAQQPLPVVGFLHAGSAAASSNQVIAFHAGLNENGFVDGSNVTVDVRWAEGHYDRLASLMTDLKRKPLSLVVTGGGPAAALAAKAGAASTPIVFVSGDDPVRHGLVASLARPGGNVTGVVFFQTALGVKRLELLHELLPAAKVVAYLVNPRNVEGEQETKDVQAGARVLGIELHVLRATSEGEIDAAFAELRERKVSGVLIASDPFFFGRRNQVGQLSAKLAMPVVTTGREYVTAGNLASYGTSIPDAYRQMGVYAGQILKGASPADLPVVQPTKFELVINLKTAKALGIDVPPTLLARADEVIE